ncbi:hypothetical protein [Micromonospora inyonensis]|uniref:Uncharacterized protein n=1 Tax=Micromonospora inyonensis TaxID=47866 RepID=A0A1C6RZZ6_9ACTN|nr:hypothetical protein [Micromonospora inyonensis]SCL22793.1 hypothetical protein GA0074694_3462 [Micromonospora inyonensis]
MHPFEHFLLDGFQQVAADTWANDERIIIQPVFFNLVPDLPAPLTDLPALQRGLAGTAAGQGGALIEADVMSVGGQPALRQIIKVKLPHQPHGQAFLGSYIVPKAACSAVLRVQAAESGPTGQREALVMSQVGPADYFRPHPYGPDGEGGLPSHVADDPAYDAQFPQHPLSRVRQVMAQLAQQVELHPDFAALPAFAR